MGLCMFCMRDWVYGVVCETVWETGLWGCACTAWETVGLWGCAFSTRESVGPVTVSPAGPQHIQSSRATNVAPATFSPAEHVNRNSPVDPL